MSEQELAEARRRTAEQERQRGRDIEDALAHGLGKQEREEWERWREEWERTLKHANEE
jgi:hypothetical protein